MAQKRKSDKDRSRKYVKQLTVVMVKKVIDTSSCVIKTMANQLGTTEYKLTQFIDKEPELSKLMARQTGIMVKKAEDVIYTAIEKGDLVTAKWYLTMKGDYNLTNKVLNEGESKLIIEVKRDFGETAKEIATSKKEQTMLNNLDITFPIEDKGEDLEDETTD